MPINPASSIEITMEKLCIMYLFFLIFNLMLWQQWQNDNNIMLLVVSVS